MDGHALRDQTIGPSLLGGATVARAGQSGGGPSTPLFPKAASLAGGRLAGAVAASIALHACLLLGFIQYVHQGRPGDDADVEAPIELVLESPAASKADMQASPEAPGNAASALPATPPAVSAPATEPAPPLAAEQAPAPIPQESVTRVAPTPSPEAAAALQRRLRALEAERAAKERERRRALEFAQEQAEERAEQRARDRARQQAAQQRTTERAKALAERRVAERAAA